jgi:hypothetical protein
MKRQQAWRIEDADRIDWWTVAEVVIGGALVVVFLWFLMVTLAATG